MTVSPAPTTVDIWVDPACPWAWLTSRWLAEVERLRPVSVVTRLFCLAEVNRDHEASERVLRSHAASERALRVLVAARRAGGDAALALVYSAMGEAYQERSEPLGELSTLSACLREAGVDGSLAAAALEDPSTLDELLEEHRAAAERGAFGVPSLSVDGSPPTFGPVVDVRLTGDAAATLWDHTAWLLRQDHFFELKRERARKADVGRYRVGAA